MTKQTAQIVRTGLLNGVKLIIEKIHNDGLQEWVLIANHGTMAQPIGGWTLASLQGRMFFEFPENLILLPEMKVMVRSGAQAKEDHLRSDLPGQLDLFWTSEQVWNNHGDRAVLFDVDGTMGSDHTYPNNRITGSSAKHQLLLVHTPDGSNIVSAPGDKPGRTR